VSEKFRGVKMPLQLIMFGERIFDMRFGDEGATLKYTVRTQEEEYDILIEGGGRI
jgi:hypothetical protein